MRSVFILFFFTMCFYASAQEQLDFSTVEKNTLNYYQNAQWDSLIQLAKSANKQDIDYYYLNYRMGVAYFYKNNFIQAIHYLQKAVSQNRQSLDDDFFVEILHLSYVYAQRVDLAMDIPMPQNTKTPDPMVKTKLGLSFGMGNYNGLDKDVDELPQDVKYADYRYQQSVNLFGIGGEHQFSSRFGLKFGYANLKFSNQAVFNDDSVFTKVYDVHQNNISVLPEFTIGKKWQLSPVLALSFNSGQPYSLVSVDTTKGIKEFDYWDYKENNIMLGMNVYRHIRNVKLGLNFGYSNYSYSNQYQFGINATYFPFGNLNLYTNTALSLKIEDHKNNFIFHQSVGFKSFSFLWLELGATLGKLKNYNDFTMGYLFNLPDQMRGLFYGKMIFVISKNISFFLEAKYLVKYTIRTEYYNYTDFSKTKIEYNQGNIGGGLLWKF